jgi:hypothetical protein
VVDIVSEVDIVRTSSILSVAPQILVDRSGTSFSRKEAVYSSKVYLATRLHHRTTHEKYGHIFCNTLTLTGYGQTYNWLEFGSVV